jgi:hypothetical protein
VTALHTITLNQPILCTPLLGGVTHPCFGNFVAFSMSADERKFNQFRAFAEEKLQPDLEHQLAKRDRIYQNLAE